MDLWFTSDDPTNWKQRKDGKNLGDTSFVVGCFQSCHDSHHLASQLPFTPFLNFSHARGLFAPAVCYQERTYRYVCLALAKSMLISRLQHAAFLFLKGPSLILKCLRTCQPRFVLTAWPSWIYLNVFFTSMFNARCVLWGPLV